MKTCNECRFALMQEFGYSNYTVEGTTFHCMLQEHPDGEFDRWYGTDTRLQYAEKCEKYEEGDPDILDVEQSDYDSLSPMAKLFLQSH